MHLTHHVAPLLHTTWGSAAQHQLCSAAPLRSGACSIVLGRLVCVTNYPSALSPVVEICSGSMPSSMQSPFRLHIDILVRTREQVIHVKFGENRRFPTKVMAVSLRLKLAGKSVSLVSGLPHFQVVSYFGKIPGISQKTCVRIVGFRQVDPLHRS